MSEVQQNGKTYVTLDDLEGQTGYDREYLRKLAKAGKVAGIRIGATWLVAPEDLEHYKNGRSNRGPQGEKQAQPT